MRDIIINFVKRIIALFPLKKIILFESLPDFSDNTKAVFDEMLKRGLNKDYKFVWIVNEYEKFAMPQEIENVKYIDRNTKKAVLYEWFAKIILSCNIFLPKKRNDQYYLFLMHGGILKKLSKGYSVRADCRGCDYLSYSDYLKSAEAACFGFDEKNAKVLGYPRNDMLLNSPVDMKNLFSSEKYSKVIYWLPTFRKHKANDFSTSTISIPFLHDKKKVALINNAAKENNTLIVVKPHFAQDLSEIDLLNLSNIKFIDDSFFAENNILHYEFLGGVDALLSDYSSVYYDYLLTDKPVGLCWEDVEQFRANNGFADIDIENVTCGAQKLYTANDLIEFIRSVSCGEDRLACQRNNVKNHIHAFTDGNSAKRVVDFIESKMK